MKKIKKIVKKLKPKTKTAERKMVKVKDLVGKTAVPVFFGEKGIIKEHNRTVPNSGKIYQYQMIAPKGVIVNVTDYKDYLYVTVFFSASYKAQAYSIGHDYEIALLEGEDAKELLEKYEANVTENLYEHLSHTFTIGSDPEMFIEDKEGKVIPAFEFLGSKKDPDKVKDAAGNTLYWDGFQAECTTQAGGCLDQQTSQMQLNFAELLRKAKKYNKDARISAKTVLDINADLLEKSKDEHVQFGCMPSLNAYGMKGRVADGREVPFRMTGGHIHYGCGKKSQETYVRIVKALDAIIGVACVSLFEKYDDPKRRLLYGLAGEYRLPPHGLEYRVLSNAWLFHPLMMNIVNDVARKAFVFGEKGFLDKYWKGNEDETIRVINECDAKGAREILERNKKVFCQIIKGAYRSPGDAEFVFDIFMKGADSAVKDMTNIEANWSLNNTNNYATSKNWRSSREALMISKAKIG